MIGYTGAVQMPTQNQWSGRNGHKAKYLIIHGTGGFSNAIDVAKYFQNPNSQVSSHYIIDLDGTIIQCVSEPDTAWANGAYTGDYDLFWNQYYPLDASRRVNANYLTISIEHVKPATDNSDILTPAQKDASFRLIRDICTRNTIPMRPADQEGGITGHFSMDRVNKTHCPGPYPWDELWKYLGVTYEPINIVYTIYPVTSLYTVPQEVVATVIQAESGFTFDAQGDKQYSPSGKDPTSFGLFQLHVGGQAPTVGDNAQMLSPYFNAQYAMPAIQRAWDDSRVGKNFKPTELAWWELFGSISGHPGGDVGSAVNTAEATNLLKIYGELTLVQLSTSGEVADFRDVDQFQPTKTQFACGFFSVAVAKAAAPVGSSPTQTAQQMIDEAEAWYAQYDGSNDGSNMLGMSLQQEYDLLVQAGLHYNASTLDDDSIRAWIRFGYPVMLAVEETSVFDVSLNGSPYPWTPAGNHIILATGVDANGNLLVRDTANCTDLFDPNSLRPGPRVYDTGKLAYVSATAVVLPWMPRPPAGFDPRKDTLMIDLTTPGVSQYFADNGNSSWKCIAGVGKGFVVGGGILNFYRGFANSGLNGMTWLGLPLSNEIPMPGAKNGQVYQVFENGEVAWDTAHLIGRPVGIPANSPYLSHYDKSKLEATVGSESATLAANAAQITALTAQVADLDAQIVVLKNQVATGISADEQKAINDTISGLATESAALQVLLSELQPFQK